MKLTTQLRFPYEIGSSSYYAANEVPCYLDLLQPYYGLVRRQPILVDERDQRWLQFGDNAGGVLIGARLEVPATLELKQSADFLKCSSDTNFREVDFM